MVNVEVKLEPGKPPVIIIDGANVADQITAFTLELLPGRIPVVHMEFPVLTGSVRGVCKADRGSD